MPDNSEEREFWTDIVGDKWVAHQNVMDALMQPVLDGVLDRAQLQTGQMVMDIGCGTGASCLAASRQVGASGHVTGADISATLLALARDRTASVDTITLIEADAASHAFETAAYDHLISRFGVMFFADPVAAFANMAAGLKPGAAVSFASWGQIPANPYFGDAARAAQSVLGPVPRPDPDAPGPFAFRDPERVLGILTDAGFQNAAVDVVALDLTPPGTLDDVSDQLMAVGPVEGALRYHEANADQAEEVRAAVRDSFARYDGSDGVRIPAEINFFTAERP